MTPTPRQVGVKLRKLRQARKLSLVKDPGLHLKVPFIQDVHRFDKRWLEFDADPREVPTKDKK